MSSHDISINDIWQWKERITEAKKTGHNSDDVVELRRMVLDMAHEMCFMVAFIESQLRIEVDEEVYEKAREMQNSNYHPLIGRFEKE